MKKEKILSTIIASSATLLLAVGTHALPLITDVVETGGDNEATDTITAKFTGQTFSNGIAGEFQNPFTVPLFGEDVPAYVDRIHQWNGATIDLPLPAYLVGGEYIMIGNDNRDNASFHLVVTVSAPSLVYIVIDNRLTDGNAGDPPEGNLPFDQWTGMTWMSTNGFAPVLNGLNRTADPALPDEIGIDEGGNGTGPGGDIQNYNSIYVKQVPAGSFDLYQPDNGGRNMYGVIVTRLPGSVENPPEFTSLTPTNNTLFYVASGGLSFTAKTVSPNQIAASNIKLLLNGTDVSSSLTIGGTATERIGSYTNLASNTLYNAQIIATDQAGRSTTNSFVFDTFVEGTAIAIEAEDYNYQAGQFVAGNTPNRYDTLVGTPEVDYHVNNQITPATAYRMGDFTSIGTAADVQRSQYVAGALTDYQLNNLQGGEWMNYTRDFPAAAYDIYLRAAAGLAQEVRLDLVTGASSSNQTVFAIGTFKLASSGSAYAPLTDASGKPVQINFSGVQTLRLTPLSANVNLQINYILLVPLAASARPPYVSAISPAAGAANVSPDTKVLATIANGTPEISNGSILVKFNGADVTGAATIANTAQGATISYDPPGSLSSNTTYTVSVVFGESNGSTVTNEWSFTTAPFINVIPAAYSTPPGTGQGAGFNIHIVKVSDLAGTGNPPALPNTSARAEQQLAGQIIDPGTQAPYDNEAGGPNGTGITTAPLINFDQLGTATGYFPGDVPFPNLDPALYDPAQGPNNIAMEVTAYLELSAGVHRLGVRSDDGFKVTTGPIFSDTNMVLGILEGGRGNGLPGGATEFDIYVSQGGVYPIRLIWYEGNGGANLEFYSVDLNSLKRTLINDPNSSDAIKAFTSRSSQIFVPEVSITSPVNGAVFESLPTNLTVTATATVQGSQIARVEFFAGTNKLGEATSSPYIFAWNNVEPARYTLTAKATDVRGLSTISSPVSIVVGKVLAINFQAATTTTPEGYLPDLGDIYGDRGNGYNYGWDDDNTANARDRNSANSPDERYDTFNHMQKALPAGRVWEIEIPNGRYLVYAVSGDPDNFDSVFDVQVEGVTVVSGAANTDQRFFAGKGTVTVSDGKLTITNGPNGSNNKINFIDIFTLPSQAAQPVFAQPTVSSSGITITWTGGGKLQETTDVASTNSWADVAGNPQGTYTAPATDPHRFFRVVIP